MDHICEARIARALEDIAEYTERIAVALENMSPPGGQDREAIEEIVDERVKRILSESLQSSSHTRAW